MKMLAYSSLKGKNWTFSEQSFLNQIFSFLSLQSSLTAKYWNIWATNCTNQNTHPFRAKSMKDYFFKLLNLSYWQYLQKKIVYALKYLDFGVKHLHRDFYICLSVRVEWPANFSNECWIIYVNMRCHPSHCLCAS